MRSCPGAKGLTNCFAILIDPGVHDGGIDMVIVPNGMIQWLQNQTANTLTAREPRVSAMIKCVSLAFIIEKTLKVSFAQ